MGHKKKNKRLIYIKVESLEESFGSLFLGFKKRNQLSILFFLVWFNPLLIHHHYLMVMYSPNLLPSFLLK